MKFYTNIKKQGTHLLVREIENGVRKDKKIKFQPTLFRECKEDPSQLHRSIFDVPLEPIQFNDMREADTFIVNNKYKIHGNQNYIAQFIAETYRGDIAYDDDKIRTHFIDIEVHADEFPEPSSAKFEISAITVYDTILKTYYVWGQNPTGNFSVGSIRDEKIKTLKIDYHECNDEIHLLKSFLSFFSGKYSPDIITGWNSDGFDIAYLVNRITNLFGNKEVSKLSPWNIVREKTTVDKFGKKVFEYDLYGISSLDYLKLFKKFGYTYGTQTSYKLDDISEVVLGQQKIKFEGSLYELYKNDYQKYVEYNIMDVSLLVAMEEKTSLLKLATSMAYIAGSNFQDVFGTVGIWDSFINKYLFEKNIIVPPKIINSAENEYVGGYVKEVDAGSFDWVCSFDINSLYPSIIVQWNMSPETLVRGMIKDPSKCTISNTGEYFLKDKVGFIPEIVSMLYDKRVEYKGISKQWQTTAQKTDSYEAQKNIVTFSNKEKAMKIFLNSLYGAMANPYFRYYEIKIAESITSTGQRIIKTVENDVNQYLSNITKQPKEYVIASDTDSVVGDTLVFVNNEKMKISDLYDSISEYEKFDENGQNFVKPVSEIKTKAFDTTTQSVIDSPIKYVMKHRVKKEMFRITVDDKTVDVTCDHSIIVNREGMFGEIKPNDICSNDFGILLVKESHVFVSNLMIKSLGIQEIDVYDIEVEKHHNFFANDILVHNSIYICIDNIMKDFNVPIDEKVDIANEICNKIEKNCIQKTFDNIFDEFNCFERRLVMKREVIASRGVWTGKKHYILNVYDNEGVRYQEPKLKVVGIESVKSSTPKVCKTAMNDLFKIIMNGTETDAQKFIGDFKNEFIKLKPHEKAFPRSVSKVTQYTDAKTIYSKTETVPINSRASILYNHLCDNNGLKCERIKDGNRMYFIYLKKKNPIRENVIGFIDVLPLEFGLDKFVDNDIQFEKAFLQPMRTIFDAIGWNVEEQDSLETFF